MPIFKKMLQFVILFALICVFVYGGGVIKNPASPVNKNPGKILSLKEDLCIRDMLDNDDFYFKYPQKIKSSSDGSIFVCDKKQLLKFNSKGTFIRNFYKHGQGPTEVTHISNYLLVDADKLLIHDSGQNKVIIFNHKTGEMLNEFKLRTPHIDFLFFHYNRHLYFLRKKSEDTQGKFKTVDIPTNLIRVSFSGSDLEKVFEFPVKHLVLKSGDKLWVSKVATLMGCPADTDSMYISNTQEYEIKLYSIKENRVLRRFTRDYNRVKVTAENRKYAPGGSFGNISVDGKHWHKVTVPDFMPDIQKVFHNRDKLWVVTSTIKDGDKVLVDVFNNSGVYEDNFYISCPNKVILCAVEKWLYWLKDDCLYAREQDEEGFFTIKRYKVGI